VSGPESIMQEVLFTRPRKLNGRARSIAREFTRNGDCLTYEIRFPFSTEAAAQERDMQSASLAR
jgi:hypothetical protein